MSHTETRPTMVVTSEPSTDTGYFKTISGILKIIELILDMVIFIVSCVWGNVGGWVGFVAISCFLTTIFLLISHILVFTGRFTQWFLWEFIMYIIMTILYFIAAIVAVIYAVQYGYRNASIIISCLFTLVAMILYSIDAYMHFLGWRTSHTMVVTQQPGSQL